MFTACAAIPATNEPVDTQAAVVPLLCRIVPFAPIPKYAVVPAAD